MTAKRKLFLLRPQSGESDKIIAKLARSLKPLSVGIVSPSDAEQLISLDGQVVVIPGASWPEGILAGFTRCSDLLAIAVVNEDENIHQVRLWYEMGVQVVFDQSVSKNVLIAAVERLLEIESESWRPKLTRRELTIFETLQRAGPSGLTRAELAARIWDDVSVQQKTIDVHVFNLRRKLSSTRYRIACVDQRFLLIEASRLTIGAASKASSAPRTSSASDELESS